MVAAEADRRIAQPQHAPNFPFDQIPRIGGGVETDVALIDQPVRQVETGFAPHAVGIAEQFGTDLGRGKRRALGEGRIVVVGNSQQRNPGHRRAISVNRSSTKVGEFNKPGSWLAIAVVFGPVASAV